MSEQINSRTARRKSEAEKKNQHKKRPKKVGSIIKKILTVIVVIGLLTFLGGVGLFAYYASSAPKLDESLLKDPLTSVLLDKDKKVFAEIGAEKRDYVSYEDIPEEMKNAILATEDVRFYKHHGMDFWRLGGAVLANFRDGFGSQGASTITQQVIKNSFLSDEKTLKRKAQEAWLAFKLEREYEKEEIFEMYFNKVLMSSNIYGFGTGAQYFYGKKLNELELHEIAMLAGLPQYPNGYNPFKNPERAEKRRNTVLSLMYKHGKISKKEMEEAQAIPVTATLLPEDQIKRATYQYPAYVDIVLDELEAAGMTDILAEGVQIQTALDPQAQEVVENAINQEALYESKEMQAAMTVVDTRTGNIVAVGGGRNYSGRNLNFASSDNKRQPGSTIKPILSYGPVIENESWSTGTVVTDEPYYYKGTNKEVRNVDGRHLGSISMREALYRSRNVPAVKVFEEVGINKSRDFANKLGFGYDKLNSSHAIGGGEYEFSTIQMAGAYAAFGSGGIYTKPHAVQKIIFRDGKTERNMKPDPVTAMKDSTAYMVTDMLRDVLTIGNAKTANVSGLDVAGKSGTTNYSTETIQKHQLKNTDVPDVWFAGYTTNYTVAVWAGYKDYTTPIQTYDRGRVVPQLLFKNVMGQISAGKQTEPFKQPHSVEEATVIKGSNPLVLASSSTPDHLKSTELFVRGTVPVEVVEEEEEEVQLAPPTDLTATYDEATNSIQLSWQHEPPTDEAFDEEVSYHIEVAIDDEAKQSLTTTTDLTSTFTGVEIGRTYEFFVTAQAGEEKSTSVSTKIMIEGTTEEEPEEELPSEDQQPVDENDTNIENENPSSPSSPNGNGNGHGNPNPEGNPQNNEERTNTPTDSNGEMTETSNSNNKQLNQNNGNNGRNNPHSNAPPQQTPEENQE